MVPMSKKQYQSIRDEKQELIVATALKLFSEKGFHSTSIKDISKSANISQGLMYNYFKSKQDLLIHILEEFWIRVGELINPKNDDEISNEEMSDFFDLMIESMKTYRNHWIVLFQLSMQKDVVSLIYSKKGTVTNASKLINLGYKYFNERFEKPIEELLLFRATIKGLAMILILTPEMCPDDAVNSVKERLKTMFIKPKLSGK